MKEQIDNLEGPPPTTEERAAMARELDRAAPTPARKFELMFGQRPTPRTDEFMTATCCDLDHCADFARQLERELGEAREQRDRLAVALEACREDSCELLGERSWWKDEERAEFRERYDATAENIVRANEALDSMKGGTSD
jgi:hypothetical protein